MASIVRSAPMVFPATARHTATVIFIHGLGDTGHGWSSAVENWRRRQRLDEVKFVLPNAPAIPITANWGMSMPGWYDIAAINGDMMALRRNEDKAGILVSQEYFHGLIQNEINAGIPANRIILGGFSQGGAMSLFAGLTAKVKLAGIVAMSSYLLLSANFSDYVPKPEFNKETPIFMAHGDADQVINVALGKKSCDLLTEMGYNVNFQIYPNMGHSACLEELDAIEDFMTERLPAMGDNRDRSEL
ncbi:Phospholipase/carboxylesterase/thioesterase [Cercophora scortea]|uniref:Acyl-protein thioesterase 1 n=1 Tax=Cercophora scortea TaxID=314031 RepID=A0AAE0J5B9_9PEZI|nr:Phospholipase/carboxylesterase/thioesterase [Cercophora scortea]